MALKGFIRPDSSGEPQQARCSLASPGSRQEIFMLLAPTLKAMRTIKRKQLRTTSSVA
jgi:hypothetical protein